MISEAEYEAIRDRMAANARGCAITGPMETQAKKRNKYGVAPKEERTVDGVVFDSKAEAHAYTTLRMLQETGQITELERQPKFPFPMGFSYVADFRVKYDDGSEEVVDVKGMETPVFKLKAKCMAHFYPEVKLALWKRGRVEA